MTVTPRQYRSKPCVISAVQYTGTNIDELWEAFGVSGIYGPTETNPDHIILTTMHGDQAPARPGDWVIPDGLPDTFYPCKDEIFTAKYEPVERRAPVQASRNHPAGTIAWTEHLAAWEGYTRSSGRYVGDQSAERIAERGGFSYQEIVDQLGAEPTTWEPLGG